MVVVVAVVLQRKVGAAVGEAPDAEAVAEPLVPPKQLTLLLMAMLAFRLAQSRALKQGKTKTDVLLPFWVLVAVIEVPAVICPAVRSSCQIPLAGVVTVPSRVLP